jgi:hypothetical protein
MSLISFSLCTVPNSHQYFLSLSRESNGDGM